MNHDCFVDPLLLMFTIITVGIKVFRLGLCQGQLLKAAKKDKRQAI